MRVMLYQRNNCYESGVVTEEQCYESGVVPEEQML